MADLILPEPAALPAIVTLLVEAAQGYSPQRARR